MKTIEIYIADDGKVFADDLECMEYELKIKNPAIDNILFFANKGSIKVDEYKNKDKFYSAVCEIIISSKSQLDALAEYSDFYGWSACEDIVDVGHWVWDDDKFIKKEED